MADLVGGLHLVAGEPLRLSDATDTFDIQFEVDVAGQLTITPTSGEDIIIGAGLAVMGELDVDGDAVFGEDVAITGNVGIGAAVSSAARLLLGAGAAGFVALALAAGVLKTTPLDGGIEYDGSSYYATVGASRREILLGDAVTGTLTYADLPTGGGTWANGGDLTFTGGAVNLTGTAVVGHTSNVGLGAVFGVLGTATNMEVTRWNNGTAGPTLSVIKSRGASIGTHAIVQDGDQLGSWSFRGDDGSDYVTTGAQMQVVVEGTPSASRIPGRLNLRTAAGVSDDDLATRWSVLPAGHLVAGTDNTYDIGAAGATRPRNAYVGTSIYSPSMLIGGGTTIYDVANPFASGSLSTPNFEFYVPGGGGSGGGLARFSSNNSGPWIVFAKSRGATDGSYTIVNNGDRLGTLTFAGADGTDWATHGAAIHVRVDGSPAASRVPARIEFHTAAGSADDDVAERWRITSAGHLLAGTDNTYDIGASGATRPRDVHIARNLIVADDVTFMDGVRIGNATGYGTLGGGTVPERFMYGTAESTTSFSLFSFRNSLHTPLFNIGHARGGVIGTFTILQDGDGLGGFAFTGADGVDGGTIGGLIACAVNGTPAANRMPAELQFYTAAGSADNDIALKMLLTKDGQLVVGHTAAMTIGTVVPRFQIHGTDAASSRWAAVRWQNGTASAQFYTAKSRGATVGTYTILADNDFIGSWTSIGSDGVDLNTVATQLNTVVDGTPSANRIPGEFQFWTAAGVSDDDLSLKWSIRAAGHIQAGADNAYDIGASGATRPRDLHLARTAFIAGNPRAIFGHTAAVSVTDPHATTAATIGLQAHGTSSGTSGWTFTRWQANAFGPGIALAKSRTASVDGGFTIVQNGDELGRLVWAADDGVDLATHGARITALVNGTPAANRIPTDLLFLTAAGASDNDIAERWRITSAGHLLTGTDNSWDIGASGATRPRRVYVGTGLQIGTRPDYTITNPTTNRSLDVTGATLGQLAQVVGTIIQDFIDREVFQ